jgi:hypothetical protein
MPTLEEVSKWSVQQLHTGIHANLPPGWLFDIQQLPEAVRVSYKDAEGTEVWTESHWNVKFALLAAYGWMWMRQQPPSGHPAWRVQPSRQLVPIHPTNGQKLPERDDLDPAHLQAVYARHHAKKG